jgi:hypothetical protein
MDKGRYSWEPWHWQPACQSEILRAMPEQNARMVTADRDV